MKRIGLVGGTGWISTVEYYRIINEEANRRLGGLHFAEVILYSLDYGRVDACNSRDDQDGVYRMIATAAQALDGAGAECLVLCANTLHQFAERLQGDVPLPLVHIASATAAAIRAAGLSRVGLLGTRQTMEMDFYRATLGGEFIDTVVPEDDSRLFIQWCITEELLKGVFSPASRVRFQEIMRGLVAQGAQGVVLGCTEIPLLIQQKHADVPLFNTLEIHARAVVEFALAEHRVN